MKYEVDCHRAAKEAMKHITNDTMGEIHDKVHLELNDETNESMTPRNTLIDFTDFKFSINPKYGIKEVTVNSRRNKHMITVIEFKVEPPDEEKDIKTGDEKIEILRAFREEYNLSRNAAAALMGYKSPNSWRDYEQGVTKVPGQLLQHIVHYNILQEMIHNITMNGLDSDLNNEMLTETLSEVRELSKVVKELVEDKKN